jgi:7SK snRNA methylphosphate capping enzyme
LKDPRMEIFKNEWFEGKRCLDIGCNDGTLTILIAMTYKPICIDGIDIDMKLINKAVKNMKYVERNSLSKTYMETNQTLLTNNKLKEAESSNIIEQIYRDIDSNNKNSKDNELSTEKNILIEKMKTKIENPLSKTNEILNKLSQLPKSFVINLGFPPNNNEIEKKEKLNTIIPQGHVDGFQRSIYFKQENYIAELKSDSINSNKYDTILCLSVVKWIHLNYGDIGVKILFYNIYHQLKIGGLFIFEPQCWKSYKKKKGLTEKISKIFSEINFRPEHFNQYLIKTYNFELISSIIPPPNSKKRFQRSFYIFKKTK